VYTYNVPGNQQPFDIKQGILRTSLAVDSNSELDDEKEIINT
jgi:hypothetical protein